MGDIFDQAAQQAPSGDIFDQAAAAMQPQASFSQRIGERLKQNFDLPQQAENVRQAVNQALDPNNHKTDGFHDLWEGLKQTYKDPANMVADALSAYVGGQLHEPEPGAPKPAQAPAQAAPEGPSLTSRVMDAAQPRIQRAATRFLMKRIPGAHLAMDAMDFARDVAKTPEAPPAPPTPAAPTGPPEMWGKQIAPAETLAAAATVPAADAAARNPAAQSIPRTLSGESALRQVLTGQDNANLMKIAKARGINVAKESQLKPGVADNLLIKKVIDDFSPDELQEFSDKYLENSRFSHKFGDIGPEAWKTLSLQTYFPELKLTAAQLKRTQASIGNAATAMRSEPAPASPTQTYYHGTAASNLDSVLANGIEASRNGSVYKISKNQPNSVFLTQNKDMAGRHGFEAGDIYKNNPGVIVEVALPDGISQKLTADPVGDKVFQGNIPPENITAYHTMNNNGTWTRHEVPKSALSITLPKGQTEADLTPLLQESLKRIRAKKAQATQ